MEIGYFVLPTPTGWALRLLRFVNAAPMPRPVRQLIRNWMYRRHWLTDMEDLCPACGRISWLDCATIPYPTCGRGACEDAILDEADEYWREVRAEQMDIVASEAP
jgi:hypothetical protein